jgi:hypothetical protein
VLPGGGRVAGGSHEQGGVHGGRAEIGGLKR